MNAAMRWTLPLNFLLSAFATTARAQLPTASFDPKNTFTVFSEYAPDSSHILAGQARQRRLATFGGAYTRRVAHFGGTEIGYRVEVRPLVFESDPVQIETSDVTVPGPPPATYTYLGAVAITGVCRPYTQTLQSGAPASLITATMTVVCGRQWTFGQSFTPIGFQYTTAFRHPVQPYIVGTLGYLYSSRPIPLSNAESFNFVIDAGAGVQVFRTHRRSFFAEVRLRHISNRDTAAENPGIDSVTYGLGYGFGR